MAGSFKVSDVVQLKSGGPKMTVFKKSREGVACTWFAGDKKETGWFPAEVLVLVEDEPKTK
jgi:uncharacterized protein YodC (DUF2158 family)